jgi:LysM repeat protein
MHKYLIGLLIFSLFILSPALAQDPQPTTEPGVTYVVQTGDTLFKIAERFSVPAQNIAQANGITDASLIYIGQVLVIPGAIIPPTLAPSQGTTYVVQPGDTLYRIAVRNGMTVAELAAANGITNTSVIFTGQTLIIPDRSGMPTTQPQLPTAQPQVQPTQPPVPTAQPTAPTALDAFAYGIEILESSQDFADLIGMAGDLDMDWVKVRVNWRTLEPIQGEINFTPLDAIVDAAQAQDINLLFTVTNAPTWAFSRTTRDENSPPDDFQTYASFVSALAGRYAGRVQAYQIWHEPNSRANWRCDSNLTPPQVLCDANYMDMLRLAYNAIKSVDPSAQVISAGLAPTRLNNRWNAIDDRLFLERMYAEGLASVSDGVGSHPGGWANPPDATCCTQPAGVETHYEDPSFYFRENLATYRQIMAAAGDTETPIWVTRFGWGTSEDTGEVTEQDGTVYQLYNFVNYTSLTEQAIYIPRAFDLGQELGYIGPMFIYNLNGCQQSPGKNNECFNSLIGPDSSPRPVYNALQSATGSEPETTPEVNP